MPRSARGAGLAVAAGRAGSALSALRPCGPVGPVSDSKSKVVCPGLVAVLFSEMYSASALESAPSLPDPWFRPNDPAHGVTLLPGPHDVPSAIFALGYAVRKSFQVLLVLWPKPATWLTTRCRFRPCRRPSPATVGRDAATEAGLHVRLVHEVGVRSAAVTVLVDADVDRGLGHGRGAGGGREAVGREPEPVDVRELHAVELVGEELDLRRGSRRGQLHAAGAELGMAGPVPNLALLLARVSDEYQPEPASLMSLARTSTRSADAYLPRRPCRQR